MTVGRSPNITVALPAATSLTVSGANLEITATGPVGTVTYAGGNNSVGPGRLDRPPADHGRQPRREGH